MKFDPSKPYGKVSGICASYPGAKYEQKGYIYDAHHKCLNPKEGAEKNQSNDVSEATAKLKAKLVAELEEVTDKITAQQEVFKKESTAANKGKLTKLTNRYNELKSELDAIGD